MLVKKYHYILGLGAVLLLLTLVNACKKVLDVDAVSSFSEEYVFSTTANAEKALLGSYSSLTGVTGYGLYISQYFPYDNDEMLGAAGTPYPDGERRDIAHFNTQPSNTQLPPPYTKLYQSIERANLCIYNIPKMSLLSTGTAQDKKLLNQYLGEAYALRAQDYLELIRNWGDVPASFLPASKDPVLYKGKTDRDSIYDAVIADLKTAEGLVPWKNDNPTVTNERFTQGAIRALRARIALYRGGYSLRKSRQMERKADYLSYYQIAKDECAAIMARSDHSLNPSFQAVFKDALDAHKQEPNGEVLWEIGESGGSNTYDGRLGYFSGPKYGSLGNRSLAILPTYFYAFDPNDQRRDVTCAPYDILANTFYLKGLGMGNMTDGKFRRDWIKSPDFLSSSAQNSGVSWPVLRFSDVLLMYAEADNELNHGPSSAGVAAFEKVRTRGFGGNAALIGVTPTDYAGFFIAVVKERALELGGEGIRKFDLLRWNLLASKLAEVKAAMTAMSTRSAPYNTLPSVMYYKNNSTTLVWSGSFYTTSAATAPSGYTSVDWLNSNLLKTNLQYYGISFTAGHSELFPIPQVEIDANPNLHQDYGY